ncbi:MAG: glycosyltransferase family 9 protein [Candidatus Hodarchaeota archaeon]
MNKTLIVRTDGIGDFIIFTAVLEAYANLFPGYKLDLLCQSQVKELAKRIPFINNVYNVEVSKLFRKRYLIYTMLTLIRVIFLKYDKLIYPIYSRSPSTDILVKLIRAGEKIAFDGDATNDTNNTRFKRNKYFTRIVKSSKNNKLEFERNIEFINKLGANIEISLAKTRLWFSDQDVIRFEKFINEHNLRKNRYVAISVGAGFSMKYWDNKKWVSLITTVIKEFPQYVVVILGSEKDMSMVQKILKMLDSKNREKIIDLCGKTSLPTLGKLIKYSKLLIGVDSGAVHMAAAVGTPNVCLIGGGHFGRFYPYGDLSKNRIVYKKLDCYGCNWQCKYNSAKCIKKIQVDDVYNTVKDILQKDVF